MTHAESVRAEFGANVRAERARQNWTQQELADKAGLSASYIRRLEGGGASPSLPTVIALARALEVEPGTLIGDGWTDELGNE